MKILRCGALLAAALFCILPLISRSESVNGFILSIDRVKHSIVPIVCGRFDAKGQFAPQLIEGTGFFVDAIGHFATDAHVINALSVINPQQPVPCISAVYTPDAGWQREAINISVHYYLFNDCHLDTDLDLAVCHLTDIPRGGTIPLFIEEGRPMDGTEIAFTGFPLGTVEPITARCSIATYAAATDAEGSHQLMLDKGSWPGASGSPIFTDNGAVIGIMQRTGTGQAIGIGFGCPSHFILQFLRKNGIVPIDNPDDQSKNKKK